jgi:hypothetical protein
MNDSDGRSQDQQAWEQLYETALLELDPNLLPQRIADAEKAIRERALALFQTNGDNNSEKEALGDAHLVLNDLKRIYLADERIA